MSEFKIGDKVEIIKSSYTGASGYEVGGVGMVVDVRSHGVSVKALGYDPVGYGCLFFCNDEVKRVEDESEPEVGGFKVGDRVRLMSGLYEAPGQFEGAFATVAGVENGGVDVYVDDGDGPYFFLNGEIEPADEPADEPTTENEVIRDNPLPYEVWIGDRLIAAFRWEDLRHALIGHIRDNVQIYTKENYSG